MNHRFVPAALAAVPILALAWVGAPLSAQVGTVRVAQENFRSAPDGPVLAEVLQGAELDLADADGEWRSAVLEGWIPVGSVREERRSGHDLVVSPSGGETLRGTPNGAARARLRPGMRLDRMEILDGWIRVRRDGWIWGPSLSVAEPEPADPPVVAGRDAAARSAAAPGPGAATMDSASRAWAIAGPQGMVVLESPAGDTLARLEPGVAAQVVTREGGWTRVRIEGWTRSGALAAPGAAASQVLTNVDPAQLELDPERFRGRILAWDVQFIALQRAERYRSDFVENEPFILTRGPGDASGFVYAAVPPSLLEDIQRLSALQRIRLVGRVRTARSALTGAPVLDLLEIRPVEP